MQHRNFPNGNIFLFARPKDIHVKSRDLRHDLTTEETRIDCVQAARRESRQGPYLSFTAFTGQLSLRLTSCRMARIYLECFQAGHEKIVLAWGLQSGKLKWLLE